MDRPYFVHIIPPHFQRMHPVFQKNTMSNEEEKPSNKRQKTLFECNAVKKVTYDRKGKSVLTDFEPSEVKEMTGSVFGKGVPFKCVGCDGEFETSQGLSGHQLQ